jgi:nucleotide-binding universal stress UspA family protein
MKDRSMNCSRVVVGVNESAISRTAVDHAAIEADLLGCDLRLVHSGGEAGIVQLMERLKTRVRERAPSVRVSGRVDIGTGPVDLLLSEAGPDDLIVVGHHHHALGAVPGYSVADRMAARHRGPVLLVRVLGRPSRPPSASRSLLVYAAGAAALEQVATFAVREARIRGCEVDVLHVTEEPGDPATDIDRRAGVTVRHRRVSGDPVTELVDASRHVDAILLGRGAGNRRLDATNRGVLLRAHCPIFLAG